MFKLDSEKVEKPEIKLWTTIVSSEKQESWKKKIYFCFIDYSKAFDWLWKRWEYQATLPASWETCMLVKKQELELDME